MSQEKDPYFTIHSAITIVAQHTGDVLWRPNPKVIGGMEPYVPQLGEDREVCQMACEFPMRVVTEKQFRAAFDQLREACLVRAREAGLVAS